jgi:thioredoxin 1
MKIFKYTMMLLTIILIVTFGCKGKTEQIEETLPMDTEAVDSVNTEIVKAEIPAQEVKAQEPKQEAAKIKETPKPAEPLEQKKESYKVTFMEIGSVNCIPCRMMQPIMKEIAEDYKGIVKVEFYDLMEPDGRAIGQRYGIRVMPTQVFLDANGREFFRHEGFYPKVELAKMLDDYLARLPK